jgi:protein-S-isoprenylcysteine O-methyltransferase Ste14
MGANSEQNTTTRSSRKSLVAPDMVAMRLPSPYSPLVLFEMLCASPCCINIAYTNSASPSYERALRDQPAHPALINSPLTKPIAGALFASGNILVLSSMWALGVTGTYLGDYFGILMDHIVTGFPFNVTASPMYWGSTMSFLGTSLWFGKPAGLFLTFAVYASYWIALKFEE